MATPIKNSNYGRTTTSNQTNNYISPTQTNNRSNPYNNVKHSKLSPKTLRTQTKSDDLAQEIAQLKNLPFRPLLALKKNSTFGTNTLLQAIAEILPFLKAESKQKLKLANEVNDTIRKFRSKGETEINSAWRQLRTNHFEYTKCQRPNTNSYSLPGHCQDWANSISWLCKQFQYPKELDGMLTYYLKAKTLLDFIHELNCLRTLRTIIKAPETFTKNEATDKVMELFANEATVTIVNALISITKSDKDRYKNFSPNNKILLEALRVAFRTGDSGETEKVIVNRLKENPGFYTEYKNF
jgi:hypothetical protein